MARAAAVRIQEIDLSTRVASFAGVFGAIVIPVKKGASATPSLCVNDRQFLNEFTPNGKVEVGYDLSYFSALAFLESADKLWVQGVMNDAFHSGLILKTKTSSDANEELPSGTDLSDPAQLTFAADETLLIYASSAGAWGDNIGIKVITHEDNSDLVPEENSFLLQIFKAGYEGSPVEQFFCSRIIGKLDGFGRNMYVEDVLQSSNYIRALNNDAIAGTVYPKSQSSILFMNDGDDGLAITDSDMISGANAFSNPDDLNVTLLLDGGYTVPAYQIALDTIAKTRMDCIAILSTPYSDEISANYLTDLVDFRKNELNLNSSYSALYTPHLQIADRFNDRKIYVSPDGYVAGAISFTANSREIWYPVAGFRRGVLNVLGVSRKLQSGELDTLVNVNINPIRFFPGRGIVIWGQKTLLARPSALQSLNVRLLLIVIEPAIKEFLEDYLFEINDRATRAEIETKISGYLENIKGRRGVFDYDVVCDESNNTGTIIDNNQLVVDVFIKPVRAIEEIPLRIVITSTDVSFTEAAQAI